MNSIDLADQHPGGPTNARLPDIISRISRVNEPWKEARSKVIIVTSVVEVAIPVNTVIN